MRTLVLTCLLLTTFPAVSAEMSSVYTDIDTDRDCTVYAKAAEGDGDWAKMACPGLRGYPVLVDYSDARESIFYGFPPEGEAASIWESFEELNYSGPKIEWRVETDGDIGVPIATIHRWFVGDPDLAENIEVLVVEKVGQPEERRGCAIAYVVATGNENANDTARRIADTQARDFECGADQPGIDAGDVLAPSFIRE